MDTRLGIIKNVRYIELNTLLDRRFQSRPVLLGSFLEFETPLVKSLEVNGTPPLSETDRFRAGSGGLSENYLLNLSDIG
jgi:hypothetical protein